MRQRITINLVVFLLMFSNKIFAQQNQIDYKLKATPVNFTTAIKIDLIAPDFYSKQLGFICKKEILLEKKTRIPFRFRLGSLDYVNKLEGKKKNYFPF